MEYGLLALWLVTYLLLMAGATPVAALLFPRFPDRGAALTLPLAFLLLFVPVYWLGRLHFGPLTVVLAVLLLAGLSALATRRGIEVDSRGYAEAAVVFCLAFAFLLLIRVVDPGAYPGGGEKFLDFGLLQTLLRSTHLPPEDMWFAGERVQYYYGGHLLAASLAELTGTAGRYAYNLSLVGFYAAEVTAAYGLAAAVAAARGIPRRSAGGLAAFFYGLASNLFAPFRLLLGLFPAGVASAVRDATRLKWDRVAIPVADFSYWHASRVIPGTITEFPLFAYLHGDLHGHMTSTAVLLLALALCFAVYRAPREHTRRRLGLVFGLLPATVGILLAVNTWSLPTGLGVVWVTLTFAPAPPWSLLPRRAAARVDALPRSVREVLRPAGALPVAALVGALAGLWVLPFLPNVLLASAGQRHIAFLPQRAGPVALLLVHGGFLVAFAAFLADESRMSRRRIALAGAAWAALLVATGVTDLAGVAVFGVPLAAGWYLLRRREAGFETALLVAGAGLLLLVEFVYVKDFAAPGRMNTVFKTYFQAWTLWSVAAGVALAAVVGRPRARLLPVPTRALPSGWEAGHVRALGAAVLLCTLSVYGAFAVAGHFQNPGDPTLDATRFVEIHHPGEAEAITWLNRRAGQPHVVAAPGRQVYSWQNPVASLTGLPTVAGWAHERIYRGPEAYERRVEDVKLIYTGDARTRAALLRKYDVRYIYLGPTERERYDVANLRDDPGIRVAHESGAVTVYVVEESELLGND
jgi:YYY domain-containing protein